MTWGFHKEIEELLMYPFGNKEAEVEELQVNYKKQL